MTLPTRRVVVLGLALTVGPAPAQQPTPRHATPLTIDVLDVGQGDAILIRSPEEKTALIDAGPSRHVVELLKARGITTLDLVVVSHHHADHYGGMAAVIREFRPRFFLASNSSHTTRHYLGLLELVRDRGIQAIGPTDRPRRIELGSVLGRTGGPAGDRAGARPADHRGQALSFGRGAGAGQGDRPEAAGGDPADGHGGVSHARTCH